MWTFPPYFNCPTGFLADTLCVRSTSSTYRFRIFVQDSLPRFLTSPETACAANLTDSLRYSFDVDTDDELEDNAAAAETPAWDFRYGRTSYDLEVGPEWLRAGFRHPITGTSTFGLFTGQGRFEIRLSREEVMPLITPTPQVNNELNLDTLIAIQADDGHSGISLLKWRIPVNVEPQITTESLPPAKEDFDYSFDFRDTSLINRVTIFDANFADYHTFRLLYIGQSDTIYRDERYKVPFAGGDSVFVGTTPEWLQIDPVSGVLFGTPGAQDAPHVTGNDECGGPDTVMVIVTDNCGLTAMKTFIIEVDSTNHVPTLLRGPRTICVTNGVPFCDSVTVTDRDLLRLCAVETLTFTSLDTGITVNPPSITGNTSDTMMIALCGTITRDESYFAQEPLEPIYIGVVVRDAAGNVDTVRYRVHLGDRPTFECAVTVSNLETSTHPEDMQILCFGAGRFGTDSLDSRYCEFELPPPGPAPVFDSRWELPIGGAIKGTDIDIRRDTNQYENITWQIRIQSGAEAGTFLYPVKICWNPSCLDTVNLGNMRGTFYLRHPATPSQFSINMRTGEGPVDNNLYTLMRMGPDSLCLEIRDVDLANALIVFQPSLSDVEAGPITSREFALEPNYPNPFTMANGTVMNFNVPERSAVKIEVYDMKGQLIRTLVNEALEQGNYPATWDGTDMSGMAMPSGTYIAKMTAGTFTSSIKMTLTK